MPKRSHCGGGEIADGWGQRGDAKEKRFYAFAHRMSERSVGGGGEAAGSWGERPHIRDPWCNANTYGMSERSVGGGGEAACCWGQHRETNDGQFDAIVDGMPMGPLGGGGEAGGSWRQHQRSAGCDTIACCMLFWSSICGGTALDCWCQSQLRLQQLQAHRHRPPEQPPCHRCTTLPTAACSDCGGPQATPRRNQGATGGSQSTALTRHPPSSCCE